MSIRLLIIAFAFSWTLSTVALAEPIPLPMGMTVHGETSTAELAEYLFEAEGPGMLSVAIRSDNREDIAFTVRTATGAEVDGGEIDIDFNGNVGAEHGIIPLPAGGEYIVSVRALGGNASFVMGVSWLPLENAAAELHGVIGLGPDPVDPTEGAEPILLGEQFGDSIDATEGERERWYSYEADVDGIFLLIVHDATADMTIEGFNDGEFAQPFIYSDCDFGDNGGNEIVLTSIREGEVYYFRVRPLGQGGSAEFQVISEIFPGGEVEAGGFQPAPAIIPFGGIVPGDDIFENAVQENQPNAQP